METGKSQLFQAGSMLPLKASQFYCVISRFIPFVSSLFFFVECEFALKKNDTGHSIFLSSFFISFSFSFFLKRAPI